MLNQIQFSDRERDEEILHGVVDRSLRTRDALGYSGDPPPLGARTPLRRAGEVEEAVGAIHYFASDTASFTTGAVLAVDGGAQWSLAGGGAQAERFKGSVFKGRL